jgi:tRNA pseudouridine38-40 synthase
VTPASRSRSLRTGIPDPQTLAQLPLESSQRVLKLTIAYDGTDFHGFAAQRDQRTVEGELSEAMQKVLRGPVHLSCAGRTDAGVHAWGQVVSCAVDASIDIDGFQHAINRQLAPEIVVREAVFAVDGFDARHSAEWRAYRYTVVNRDAPDPFLARYAWWVGEPLDLSRMRLGADPFVGEHDFASFCRKGPEGSTTVRRVLASDWHDEGEGILHYEIRATAFCWQMVRSVVGTLVDVGLGRIRPGEIMGILRSRDRANSGRLAPPEGLCLYDVGYGKET